METNSLSLICSFFKVKWRASLLFTILQSDSFAVLFNLLPFVILINFFFFKFQSAVSEPAYSPIHNASNRVEQGYSPGRCVRVSNSLPAKYRTIHLRLFLLLYPHTLFLLYLSISCMRLLLSLSTPSSCHNF